MPANIRHPWMVSPRRAIEIQKRLSAHVKLKNGFPALRRVAGADVAYSRRTNRVYAAIAVFDYPSMSLVDEVYADGLARFPYIPGLLTFREGPVVWKAFQKLAVHPDLVLFDGQGIAHPRRLGLASHMGLWLNLATIGCAKSPLSVQFSLPGKHRGCATRMMVGDEKVGVVLRTRDDTKPVYVSPGHMVDLPTAIEVVLRCLRGYRLPEPTRIAHILVTRMRRADSAS